MQLYNVAASLSEANNYMLYEILFDVSQLEKILFLVKLLKKSKSIIEQNNF
jgi:hypothetical protein